MRPRKPILIYSASELWAGNLAWVLQIRSAYQARATASVSEAQGFICGQSPPYVVIAQEGAGAVEVLAAANRYGVPSLEVRAGSLKDTLATRAVKDGDAVALMAVLGILTQRKRGPKKHVVVEECAA